MSNKKLSIFLLFLVMFSSACVLGEPKATATIQTLILRETRMVTVEVTRLVKKTQIVPVEVTRLIRETVVVEILVTPVPEDVTPTPQPEPLIRSEQAISLEVPRSHHTATRLGDGRILLVGGSVSPDQFLESVEIFDPQLASKNLAAPLNTARHGHTATLLLDGRVLVVGGYLPQTWLSDAEVYDPSSNTWTVAPPIYSHGVSHTATLMKDGRVLVVGGCTGSGICTDRVEIFDPTFNSWTEVAPLPFDRASHTANLLDQRNVLVAGGASLANPSADNEALVFDVRSNQWSSAGLMGSPRVLARSVQLLDGRILVVGGAFPDSVEPPILASAEIFDPISKTWSQAAALSEARYQFAMEVLPDGRVLVVGGVRDWDGDYSVSQVEMYNPVEARWVIVGELIPAIPYPTSVLLSDGRMWVSGMQAGRAQNTFTTQTWLFLPNPINP